MIDMEISLAKAFGWSLFEIDRTNIESLLPFIARFGKLNDEGNENKAFADEVDWL